MSRLEKAREVKAKKKKQTRFLLIVMALILCLGLVSLFYGSLDDEEAAGVTMKAIDRENSVVFIDVFDLTHAWIYLSDDFDGEQTKIKANGTPLEYHPEDRVWRLTMSGYSAGDELTLEITAASLDKAREETIVIESE